MGCGDSETHVSNWNDVTQTTTLEDASPEEKRIREAMTGLGDEQQKAIMDAIGFAREGDFLKLSPQHQTQLDTAYDAARNRMVTEGKDYADFLSGGRGLRMSDTPVAQQALDRYGLGMADLQSNRAMAGLNLGLQTNTARMNSLLGASSALPAGSVFGHNTLFNERLAQATQNTKGFGGSNTSVMPSLLTQFQQGAAAYKDIGSGTNQFSQAGMNFMSMGAMSDERLKQDIRPVSWRWRSSPDKEYLGVVAQELEKSHPHLVKRHESGYLMVDYGALTAMLLNERKQLYALLNEKDRLVVGAGDEASTEIHAGHS